MKAAARLAFSIIAMMGMGRVAVADAAPYFSDGSIKTLDEAIRLMAWHQLGKQLTPAEIQSISAFLGSLTGEIDQRYIAPPEPLAAERRTGA